MNHASPAMHEPPSQASSHFPLEPIPASILADREIQRRNAIAALRSCKTACAELDGYVLLGGFERGNVVGISAEDEEMGVQIAMQTLAHSLTSGLVRRGLIITPKPQKTILSGLRDSIRAELKAQEVPGTDIVTKTRETLDRVLLSCVFDLDGLWEVLAELDKPATPDAEFEREEEKPEEIQDSQDEDELFTQDQPQPPPKVEAQPKTSPSALPDIIIITHFSTLLTSLFTHREKSAAHSALQLLGSHLRYLSRTLPSSPLILVLNSTTTTATASESTDQTRKPLDQTLRSIFNPPPLPITGYIAPSSRRNKPSFGLVFAQLLDVHLLCTRLPRGPEDAEAAVEGRPARYVWIVECLLDEVGVWEGKMGVRRRREQRWAGVDVIGGRVVGGGARKERERDVGDVRVAGGFGGRRD